MPCFFALRERTEGQAACLLRNKAADGIEDAFPWLVQVDQNTALLQDFLSDNPINGLWSAEAGLLVYSDLDFEPLLRHLRKFHRCQIAETGNFVMLRYWEPELLARLFDIDIGHIQGLVTPETSVIVRYDDTAHVLTATSDSTRRPGKISHEEAQQIWLLLLRRRRSEIAGQIRETFPDHVEHLSERAVEREVQMAWDAANKFRLRDGEVRAKFIIMAVALAPGFHVHDTVAKTISASRDPDQTFRDLDCIIRRRVGSFADMEVN